MGDDLGEVACAPATTDGLLTDRLLNLNPHKQTLPPEPATGLFINALSLMLDNSSCNLDCDEKLKKIVESCNNFLNCSGTLFKKILFWAKNCLFYPKPPFPPSLFPLIPAKNG
jgi:hypothetical protein